MTATSPPWARALIDAATGPIPEYGSRAWDDLPDDDRRKVAACAEAAERDRIRRQQPNYLAPTSNRRARDIVEANRPRPDDYTGGSVVWDGVAAGE